MVGSDPWWGPVIAAALRLADKTRLTNIYIYIYYKVVGEVE